MRILVTSGNTQTPVDAVRCLTNIFTGRTGAQIASAAADRGHAVTVLTSHPETVPAGIDVRPYRTFDDLRSLMAELIPGHRFDALVHCAAVSDFAVTHTLTPAAGTLFDPARLRWSGEAMVDAMADKVSSGHRELWLRLTPTPKLADMVRGVWGFRGTFVKFKLEAGKTDAGLQAIAARSRRQSDADWIVANTLEERHSVAWIAGRDDRFRRVSRGSLASALVETIETAGAV